MIVCPVDEPETPCNLTVVGIGDEHLTSYCLRNVCLQDEPKTSCSLKVKV